MKRQRSHSPGRCGYWPRIKPLSSGFLTKSRMSPAAARLAAAHVDRLIFCRQVISEAMRLFPPAPGIGRQPNAAIELGGMQISPRTRIHIPCSPCTGTCVCGTIPTAFDPDRFAADKSRRARVMLFAVRGRATVCIGASFATIEAAVILAVFVRAFRFQAIAGHKPKPVARVTLRASRRHAPADRAREARRRRTVFPRSRKAS